MSKKIAEITLDFTGVKTLWEKPYAKASQPGLQKSVLWAAVLS